jgi:hypothetical protein
MAKKLSFNYHSIVSHPELVEGNCHSIVIKLSLLDGHLVVISGH